MSTGRPTLPPPPIPGIEGLGIDFLGATPPSPLPGTFATEELARVRSALHAHLDRKSGDAEKALAAPVARTAVSAEAVAKPAPALTRRAERTPPRARGKENTSPSFNDAPTIADTKAKFWRAGAGSSAKLPAAPAQQTRTPVGDLRSGLEDSGALSCSSLLDVSPADTPSALVTPRRAAHERRLRSNASPLSSFLESSADRTVDRIANADRPSLPGSPRSRRTSREEDLPSRPALPTAMARTLALSATAGGLHEDACSEAASSEGACGSQRELSCSSSSGSARHLDYEASTIASSGDAPLSHRPPDRADRHGMPVRCGAWLEEAPEQFLSAPLARGAACAKTAVDADAPASEVPARTDRRWRPAAMAVSLALKEVRRQQREAGGQL